VYKKTNDVKTLETMLVNAKKKLSTMTEWNYRLNRENKTYSNQEARIREIACRLRIAKAKEVDAKRINATPEIEAKYISLKRELKQLRRLVWDDETAEAKINQVKDDMNSLYIKYHLGRI
jgi:hypothetical protein